MFLKKMGTNNKRMNIRKIIRTNIWIFEYLSRSDDYMKNMERFEWTKFRYYVWKVEGALTILTFFPGKSVFPAFFVQSLLVESSP